MKGIYLASYRALHNGHDLVYQDINGLRDLGGDMLDIDVSPFDFVIATPPCNYWSIANYRRSTSEYSQKTCHLLPFTISKLVKSGKPFIIENVRNNSLFEKYCVLDLCKFYGLSVFCVGRHTYFTNTQFLPPYVEQPTEYIAHSKRANREGGENVHKVIEEFINYCESGCKLLKHIYVQMELL